MPDMIEVQSSFIKAIGFEPDSPDDQSTGTVTIAFNDGAIFEYAGVSVEDFTALVNAPSVGKYFHAYFKRRYSGVRR